MAMICGVTPVTHGAVTQITSGAVTGITYGATLITSGGAMTITSGGPTLKTHGTPAALGTGGVHGQGSASCWPSKKELDLKASKPLLSQQ